MTRRRRLQLFRVRDWKSRNRRTGLLVLVLGPGQLDGQFLEQPAVAGQAQDAVDPVALAPCHQRLAGVREGGAKHQAVIGPEHDPHPWPARPDAPGEPRHFLRGAGGGIDGGGAKPGRQQMRTAEHPQRQIAGAIVDPMRADWVETGKIRQNISRRGDRLMKMHSEERVSDAELANVLVAIEVSKQTWLVAGYIPSDGRTARHKIRGGDVETLLSVIARLCQKERRATGRSVKVICRHEAGDQGFRLHRRLAAAGIESCLIDATSLQVNRRARRAKTDAIDVEALLGTIIAYCRGETSVCRMVRVPGIVDEDAKRTHRERKRLVKERTGHINRIKALLALHGIHAYEPIKADRRRRLQEAVASDGQRLPPRLHREISREIDRLELVLEHLAEVAAERDEVPRDLPSCDIAILHSFAVMEPYTKLRRTSNWMRIDKQRATTVWQVFRAAGIPSLALRRPHLPR